jgi:Right handed beta helix region
MFRIIAKLFAVAFVLIAFLHVAPLCAAPFTWVSSTGSDANPCTAALPCATLYGAASNTDRDGQINCINSPSFTFSNFGETAPVTIDCAGMYQTTYPNVGAIWTFSSVVIRIRNLTISGSAGGYPAISIAGSGTLILENCVFENFNASGAGAALDIEPTGPLNLVIKNSRISNNAAGVLLKPAAGGSINATLDHVTVTGNTGTGGGIKTDSANGIVNLDIIESEISNNGGVGINARSGGSLNMVSIKNSFITKNSAQGVQANGANVGVTVQTTLLDQNTGGATSVVAGGHISTYGNNSIVGSSGSGFTGTASLQ